jgi:hypothetical protein
LSRGVVIAWVQTDVVLSLHHQRRDLHQSTYPYLSEDRDSSYYHLWWPALDEEGRGVRRRCMVELEVTVHERGRRGWGDSGGQRF